MPEYQRMLHASRKSTDSTMRFAESLWQEAKHDNTISDSYTLFTVIFSIVMFICGVCTKLTRVKVVYTSLGLCRQYFFADPYHTARYHACGQDNTLIPGLRI